MGDLRFTRTDVSGRIYITESYAAKLVSQKPEAAIFTLQKEPLREQIERQIFLHFLAITGCCTSLRLLYVLAHRRAKRRTPPNRKFCVVRCGGSQTN